MFKIIHGVISKIGIKTDTRRMCAHLTHEQSVAVCWRARCLQRTRGTACTRDILDHQLLAQNDGHLFGHDTADDIGVAARSIRHDDGDGLIGIGLGLR